VRRDAQALVASKAFKDQRVTPETAGRRVHVVVVPLVLRVLRVSKGQKENAAHQVPVRVVLQAPWAPRVSVVRWANRAQRVILVPPVPKALAGAMV